MKVACGRFCEWWTWLVWTHIIFAWNNNKIPRTLYLKDLGCMTREYLEWRFPEAIVLRFVREKRHDVTVFKKKSKSRYACRKLKRFVCLSYLLEWCTVLVLKIQYMYEMDFGILLLLVLTRIYLFFTFIWIFFKII